MRALKQSYGPDLSVSPLEVVTLEYPAETLMSCDYCYKGPIKALGFERIAANQRGVCHAWQGWLTALGAEFLTMPRFLSDTFWLNPEMTEMTEMTC